MKTLYIECNMGAAGDMLMAALYELLSDEQKHQFVEKMNGLGLPGVKVAPCRKTTCGIAGTHMEVTVHGEEERETDEPHGHPQDLLHASRTGIRRTSCMTTDADISMDMHMSTGIIMLPRGISRR